MSKGPVLLAFSGGLDTSWSVLHLRETTGCDVVTATVDTGGFDADELAYIERRSKELGATEHRMIDGCGQVFDRFVRYLVAGNARRGGTYPLCVAAERVVQALEIARLAKEVGASAVAHGSTGAGNDQIRFDVALSVELPGVPCLAPVRTLRMSRGEQTDYLRSHGHEASAETRTYSVNRGIWGTTIGGGGLHDPTTPVPDDCWPDTVAPDLAPAEGVRVRVGFERGVPVSVDGVVLPGVDVVRALAELGAAHGVGRGIHTGDTILGIKGRLAFEAPAAEILLFAHRELEKLVLTKDQQTWKDRLGDVYGGLVHEARWFDPVARDIEAFLDSSQRHVTGEVEVRLVRGRIEVVTVNTAASLMGRLGAVYGEGSAAWTGEEAQAYSKLYGLPSVLAARRDAECEGGASA